MSTLRKIKATVRRLSPRNFAAFATWFDRFRTHAAEPATAGELMQRLKCMTRAERRALAQQAAEESAKYYRHQPGEILPDITFDAPFGE